MLLSIQIEVWGDHACFTRPEFRAERVSYEVMTPSAARGILEAIYWHPGLQYHIHKIYVLNPIEFTNIRRNEVRNPIFGTSALTALKFGLPLEAYAGENRQQRASMILKNVHYVIEAYITMSHPGAPGDTPKKFYEILKRRANLGQCFSQPYLGCREFPAHFRQWNGSEIPTLPVTKDLGYILYDMDYSNPENIKPLFFNARMVNGVVAVPRQEVVGA